MKKLFLLLMMVFSVAVFAQQKLSDKVVETGCGMCIFKQPEYKSCKMAVKIGSKFYQLEGVKQKDLGDAHADMGYCKAMRKARVSGTVKNGKFYATKFEYL